MKYLVLVSVLFLSGCVTPGPVKHSFPKPPDVLTERCPDLNRLVDNEEKLSEFLKVVTKNYTLYHDCAAKHELLVKWLKEQTEIHDSVFNKGK